MTWLLGFVLIAFFLIYLVQQFAKGDIPAMIRSLRWVIGGGALAAAALFTLGGRPSYSGILAIIGISVLLRGRLGPIDFTVTSTAKDAKSKVRSRYFSMQMDHESGDIQGEVIFGKLAGRKLETVDEFETRDLLNEVSRDPDSLALLGTWLDANRAGWREYLGQTGGESANAGGDPASPAMDEHRALEILGLKQGASVAQIKAAHRRLLKVAHPDQGGSNFLAARINAAKDFLLKSAG